MAQSQQTVQQKESQQQNLSQKPSTKEESETINKKITDRIKKITDGIKKITKCEEKHNSEESSETQTLPEKHGDEL